MALPATPTTSPAALSACAGRSTELSLLEKLCSRDRLLIALALAALTLVSWLPMLEPLAHPGVGGHLAPCCGARFSIALSMWVVMMTGMMLPSVAPMVLTHAAIMRRRVARGAPFVASGLFLAGYLLSWSGFSAVAAAAQCTLFRAALLDRHTLAIGPWAGAAVLLVAGAFQFSAAKSSCLSHCRAPLGYFITEWRDGRMGAVSMGLRHGLFCIGCCWLLMAVLFAVGIMNLLWGAVITLLVVAEKVLPWPRAVVWVGAAVCCVGAIVLACGALGA